MEENRVTHPKVFISYAWGRNNARAKDLADRLLADGIQVTIDVYDLKPGMNKHKFMQQLVNDPDVEKVLMLCDEEYKRKADDFKGGVGEEATIISPEVYGHVDQTKFVPVVLEKDGKGEAYLPTMLKSLLYIDFSDPDSEPAEYRKLVGNLWGMPDLRKPIVADRPTWINSSAVNLSGVETELARQESMIRRAPDPGALQTRIAQKIVVALESLQGSEADLEGLIVLTEPIRNSFVRFLENGLQQEGFTGERIGSLVEKMYNGITIRNDRYHVVDEVYRFFFWDVFICAAALLIEYERFADLRRMLNRTYFLRNLIGTNNDPTPYTFSELRHHCRYLEECIKPKKCPQRVSLQADLLVKREYGAVITKRNLVVADLVLAHLAMLYGQTKSGFTWFPNLSCYASYAGYGLPWSRLPSKAYCEKLYPLFDVGDIESLKGKVCEMADLWDKSGNGHYMYGGWGIPNILSKAERAMIGMLP